MTSPKKAWEGNLLQNASSLKYSQNALPIGTVRTAPALPPRPDGLYRPTNNYSMPYSGYGGTNYGSYGGLGSYRGLSSYGSYSMPYNSSMYNSYGGYNSMGMYGPYGGYSNLNDDAERRFIQYAEESSRKTFSNVESIVRAFSSIAMMLDNTFFAMTSSFRAILSMADNFGRLRSTFGQIWYSVSIFRLFSWLYKKFMELMGYRVRNSTSVAWRQATGNVAGAGNSGPSGSNWPTLAFLGVLVSAPYIISKFLPKYEDKSDMTSWKSPGISAKAAFDFTATSSVEMSVMTNDEIILAPTYIQESMNLKNTGWVFALNNGKSGVVPLNYLVLNKSKIGSASLPSSHTVQPVLKNNGNLNQFSMNDNIPDRSTVPVLKNNDSNSKSEIKTHTKRVSFGENQIFENVDLEDIIKKAEDEAKQYRNSLNDIQKSEENEKDSNVNHRFEKSA